VFTVIACSASALLQGVGDLAGHAARDVLAGGHHHDAPARGARRQCGAVPGVGLDEEQHRAGVDRPVRVEPRGVDRVEGAVAAAEGVVGDEDVEPSAQRRGGRGDEFGGRGRIGEVAGSRDDPGRGITECRAHGGDHVLGAVGAPGHGGVVRHMVV